MQKVILVTGATDGIGFETAKMLTSQGHHVLIHGRNPSKLQHVEETLSQLGNVSSYVADLSDLCDVDKLSQQLISDFETIDVVINNAGVFSTQQPRTEEGLDVRFVVNTLAPYKLTKALLPLLPSDGRVVNLSSAAQGSVSIEALIGNKALADGDAYAQSKLALTMWSRHLGLAHKDTGPMIVSVNPKSLLGSKMVKDAFGIAGGDLSLGADILVRASLSAEFANAHGLYFDNDLERFSEPHVDALDDIKVQQVIEAIERLA
ncbi:SDR family NAD(P)-dependent oxidoreductase [Vibrio tubiashii]|uniref:SDR family NAD(P)-dependent oxidoreductase n=1 Tax=Vibrio tubiashii TaxID=29498 RepID=UPI00234E78B0|nr:SDR family NAD(P)-dependent oxidoreductase [Vibrio tubiashii]WCP69634.1 SDR family NAD(P)-dependent oxidoreductase [Vibrio tubiashii]